MKSPSLLDGQPLDVLPRPGTDRAPSEAWSALVADGTMVDVVQNLFGVRGLATAFHNGHFRA